MSTRFVALLKACAQKKDICKGTRVHADILQSGMLEKNPYIASTLVSMYAKCGAVAKAEQVLRELPVRDVVSWSALIAGYAQLGQGKEALICFDRMQQEGLSPDAVTFACILKACGSIRAAENGKQIHREIARQGLLGKDIVLANALIDMYIKCGALVTAQQVFDELPVRDVVSWNTLIAGYTQHGQGGEALNCYERMQRDGFCPNTITFICILKACGSIGAANKGNQIHDEIVTQGLLGKNVVLGTALIDMHAKHGALAKAQQVLDELLVRDVVSWNALIAGYVHQSQGQEALNCFERMLREGLSPNKVTFIHILKACGNIGVADKGKQIHDEIVSQGLLGKDIILSTALVDMHVKCGALTSAQQVLDDLVVRDVVSWNALLTGYVQQGQGEQALNFFERMQQEGLSPNTVTFLCILKACGSIGSVDKGKQIHDEIVCEGLLGKDIVLGNALVDMYAKCGALAEAQQVLDALLVRDVVSWSALIAGYTKQEQAEEALSCFERMQREGLYPNMVTFACILKACGSIGAAEKGKQIHNKIVSQGLLGKDMVLGTALVDMYAKCGVLAEAEQVLAELPAGNVVSWNALIAGYAQQVQGEEALNCFERMQCKGISPDEVTFTCVLNACSRSGLVDAGQTCLVNMSKNYGITPNIEHHTCMVDLFGRAGHFDKAMDVIMKLPSSGNYAIWSALLGACRKWGNVKLGRQAFEHAIQTNKYDVTSYVCMSNIYVVAGMLEDADEIEAMRLEVLH